MAKPRGTITVIDDPDTFQYLIPANLKPFTPEEIQDGYVNDEGARRIRLSPTKMDTLYHCPARFRDMMLNERESDSIHTFVGKAAHTILERVNKGEKLAYSKPDGLKSSEADGREMAFRNELIKLCNETMGKKKEVPLDFTKAYKLSKMVIRDYQIPFGYRIFAAESKQVLRFSLFDFSYIPDLVLEHVEDGSIAIVDYKTNAQKPKTKIQLDMCVLMTWVRYPHLRGRQFRAGYHMLRTDKLEFTEYSSEQIDELWTWLNKQVKTIAGLFKFELFDTRPSNDACHWCDLKASCADVFDPASQDASFIRKAFED